MHDREGFCETVASKQVRHVNWLVDLSILVVGLLKSTVLEDCFGANQRGGDVTSSSHVFRLLPSAKNCSHTLYLQFKQRQRICSQSITVLLRLATVCL